ncbi:MAG: alpha-1,3-galactosidase, partial [Bacteroides sp.]
ADDARSWFESGMVRDVTIRNNNFIECGTPVILISPENDQNEGSVHRNIRIANNRFQLSGRDAIFARSVDGLKITDNLYLTPTPLSMDELVKVEDCKNVVQEGNRIESN